MESPDTYLHSALSTVIGVSGLSDDVRAVDIVGYPVPNPSKSSVYLHISLA